MKRKPGNRVRKQQMPQVSRGHRLRELFVNVRFLVLAYDALRGVIRHLWPLDGP